MKIEYTHHFLRRLQKRYRRDSKLREKVIRQTQLFQQNPRHPSLKLHKLKGQRSIQYSFWVEGDVRIVFIWHDETIIFTDILAHDEY